MIPNKDSHLKLMRLNMDSMNDELFIKKIYKVLDEKPFEGHADEENSTA